MPNSGTELFGVKNPNQGSMIIAINESSNLNFTGVNLMPIAKKVAKLPYAHCTNQNARALDISSSLQFAKGAHRLL